MEVRHNVKSTPLAFALAAILLAPFASAGPAASQANRPATPAGVAYELSLAGGKVADVYPNGLAKIYPNAKNRSAFEVRRIPLAQGGRGQNQAPGGLPDKAHLIAMLSKELPAHPYVDRTVVVVYRPGVASQDVVSVPKETLSAIRRAMARHLSTLPSVQYTNDASTNRILAQIGTDHSERLFRQFNRSLLSAMRSTTANRPSLDFSNAYRIHITNASARHALQVLGKLPSVAYVSPDWLVHPMNTQSIPVPAAVRTLAAQRAAITRRLRLSTSTQISAQPMLPSNFASMSSLQSMLNAPSNDVMAAYDEIQRHFHQLPGAGEIITNVSVGDLDDASAASNSNDPCNFWVSALGPTTELVGNQRYLNLPSMPLIPAYTADANGNLNGSGEVCGVDPFLGEVDLDFSMMAPLPHDQQRAAEQGSGFTDLLGVAPGAQYRLVVPGDPNPSMTDIDAAFLGAAQQNPRPNVITASLGFGLDVDGFPGRFLEDDPMTQAVVASIVQKLHVVVCISANDGTRTFTYTAIGPSGGSAATNQIAPGQTPSNLDDVAFSTAPSLDFDSGSIAAGGTTLDDLSAVPPQYQLSGSALQAQHAYAETRWTGFTNFSSGYGTRVNLSAPSDNVIALLHQPGGQDDSVDVVLEGGTSASAPEIAAAAAVTQQVARLTGQPFGHPMELRDFLEKTATPVPPVSQADTNLNVGPQINLRRAVETLLSRSGVHDGSSVARVAIEQRRNFGDINDDGVFISDTDPNNIDLQHDEFCGTGCNDGVNEYQWITIAPDWEFVPNGATYKLTVAGTRTVLATTPWARLLPVAIFNAAGLPLVSTSTRTVMLTYTASLGTKQLSVTFPLTFGPAPQYSDQILSPQVAPVVRGSTIAVRYDLTHLFPQFLTMQPVIAISMPGRVNPWTGRQFRFADYTAPITAPKGTVQIPVSALQGGGVYGVSVLFEQLDADQLGAITGCSCAPYEDVAYIRVAAPGEVDARPAAPLLSSNGSMPGHFLEIPYGSNFQLSYDLTNVPGATGGMLEISAPGPSTLVTLNYNTFNNPNGSERDNNPFDTGSIYYVPVRGVKGTITLNGAAVDLRPTMTHVVRVIPMKGGAPAGEGSDVSTVMMDGVAPEDGGLVSFGYGVSAKDSSGFLTSAQLTASGDTLSSLETFNQSSNAVTNVVASQSAPNPTPYTFTSYFTPPLVKPFSAFAEPAGGYGMHGNDVGLFGSSMWGFFPSGNTSYNALNPATGSIGAAWTPPSPLDGPFIRLQPADNQMNNATAFLGETGEGTAYTGQGEKFYAFTSDVGQNTFGPVYDITAPIQSQNYGWPEVWGFCEDIAANNAVAVANDSDNSNGPPMIESVNLATGAISTFNTTQHGAESCAIDSNTHTLVVPTFGNSIGIYNLTTDSGTTVTPPFAPGTPANVQAGYDHLYVNVAADPVHHLFFVVDLNGSEKYWADNNAISDIFVLDQNGNTIKVLERVALLALVHRPVGGLVQVNPSTRTFYVPGPFEEQLAPFKY